MSLQDLYLTRNSKDVKSSNIFIQKSIRKRYIKKFTLCLLN